MSDYQLRYAAGRYWLFDTKQPGFDYRAPVCLNETGAYLWELSQKGLGREQIAERLSADYGVDMDEALRDTESFFQQF